MQVEKITGGLAPRNPQGHVLRLGRAIRTDLDALGGQLGTTVPGGDPGLGNQRDIATVMLARREGIDLCHVRRFVGGSIPKPHQEPPLAGDRTGRVSGVATIDVARLTETRAEFISTQHHVSGTTPLQHCPVVAAGIGNAHRTDGGRAIGKGGDEDRRGRKRRNVQRYSTLRVGTGADPQPLVVQDEW